MYCSLNHRAVVHELNSKGTAKRRENAVKVEVCMVLEAAGKEIQTQVFLGGL
jgi:hypothetical protein